MRRVLALVTALVSLFFVFYFARLLAVTHFLRQVRVGGNGAYIGAVAFPFIAIVAAWATVRLWRGAASHRDPRSQLT